MRTKTPAHRSPSVEADRILTALHGLGQVYSLRNPLSSGAPPALTPAQVHAIVAVGLKGPLSMGDLRRWLGATGPTVTGIVDRLERGGLVERTRDEADRRVVRLSLTRRGQAAKARLVAAMQGRVESMLGLLDDADRRALVVLLERLAERVATRAGAAKRKRP